MSLSLAADVPITTEPGLVSCQHSLDHFNGIKLATSPRYQTWSHSSLNSSKSLEIDQSSSRYSYRQSVVILE